MKNVSADVKSNIIKARLVRPKLKLYRNYLIFTSFDLKALNERISEWAHFLDLAKWFRRYLNFSAPKNRVLLDKP